MASYIVRILSLRLQLNPEKTIKEIFECPSLRDLMFPLVIPRRDDKVRLESPDEFQLGLLPPEFIHDKHVNLDVYGEKGLPLSGTFHSQPSPSADVINSRFKTEDISRVGLTIPTLKSLFEELAPVFQTTHASVYNKASRRRDGRPRWFPGVRYPYGIDWITYFGPEVIEYLGRERFDHLKSVHEMFEVNKGIIVILQEEPFLEDDPGHRAHQERAEAEMGLPELVSQLS